MKFKPLHDRVLIEPIIKEMTDSGLHIPESAKTVKQQDPKGAVIDIGDEVEKVRVGDVVYFDDSCLALRMDGKILVLPKEEQLYGIYVDGE